MARRERGGGGVGSHDKGQLLWQYVFYGYYKYMCGKNTQCSYIVFSESSVYCSREVVDQFGEGGGTEFAAIEEICSTLAFYCSIRLRFIRRESFA